MGARYTKLRNENSDNISPTKAKIETPRNNKQALRDQSQTIAENTINLVSIDTNSHNQSEEEVSKNKGNSETASFLKNDVLATGQIPANSSSLVLESKNEVKIFLAATENNFQDAKINHLDLSDNDWPKLFTNLAAAKNLTSLSLISPKFKNETIISDSFYNFFTNKTNLKKIEISGLSLYKIEPKQLFVRENLNSSFNAINLVEFDFSNSNLVKKPDEIKRTAIIFLSNCLSLQKINISKNFLTSAELQEILQGISKDKKNNLTIDASFNSINLDKFSLEEDLPNETRIDISFNISSTYPHLNDKSCASQKIEFKFDKIKNLFFYVPKMSDANLWKRSAVADKFGVEINADTWCVFIFRDREGKNQNHALIMFEGIEANTQHFLECYHFIPEDDKNNSCPGGKIPTEIVDGKVELYNKISIESIDPSQYVYRAYVKGKSNILALLNEFRTFVKNKNTFQYYYLGNKNYFSCGKAHADNCLTFVYKKINTQIKDIKKIKYFFPKKTLQNNRVDDKLLNDYLRQKYKK